MIKGNKTSVQIIDEIHHKVDISSELALAEAKRIIDQAGDAERISRLERVAASGFINAKEVIAAQKEVVELNLAKEKAKWILHYQTLYPQKYILVEDLRKICQEYSLVIGSDRDYIDSIPEKNQKEIISFKLRKEDYIYYEGIVRTTSQTFEKGTGVIDWKEIPEEDYNDKTEFGSRKQKGIGRNSRYYICNNDYFSIAATANMFDLKGKIIEGIDIKQKVEWDDPIVLKAVKYGYLIVSVWGQELAIEKLRNEKSN